MDRLFYYFIISLVQVEIDVKINVIYVFYDMIQHFQNQMLQLSILSLFSFITLAGMYAFVLLVSLQLTIYLDGELLWLTGITHDKARKIEGASQRVQEDTIKFTRIMEGLGTSLIESIMILFNLFLYYLVERWYSNFLFR